MADVITPNLGLQLPQTYPGDEWGGKLNANFTAIDVFAGGGADPTGARTFGTAAEVLADVDLTYTPGTALTVTAGQDVLAQSEAIAYTVAPAAATDQHVTTAGGVKLYVQAGDAGFNVRAFGAKGDGVADDTAEIQAAINAVPSGTIFLPAGSYFVSAAITTKSNIAIQGEGDSSEILVATDIEVFKSSTGTLSSAVFRAEFRDFFINKSVSAATTKYDIHLYNPSVCLFERVRIKSGHDDDSYSSTNVGGIWLDRPAGSTASAFMNRVDNCWIQNNSIYFRNITDSAINGGFVWGHTRQFAIRLEGGGANAVEMVQGLICSKYNGGIWLDGSSVNQIRIHGNEFDGNPLLDTGTGIYCPQQAISVSVTGNTFWGCDKHGIDITDPVGWTISGNSFWKNNAADNFYDDVRITGVTFGPNGNTVSANSFVIDEARTNKGYAIREVNGGFAPVANTYNGNGILGPTGYLTPAIRTLSSATVIGNTGMGAENITQLPGTTARFGANAEIVAADKILAPSGTLDLSINTDPGASNPGGFSGVLSVSATRTDYEPESRRTVYAVVGYGTTATFTSIASQDGSGGGIAFGVTMASNGVIRITNIAGIQTAVRASFSGVRGLA